MATNLLLIISAVYLLAGFVKGFVGFGMPTISMGLLALVMSPVQAAALLVVPAIITNLWQGLAGPFLRQILKRLWPMFIGILVGTWSGAGLMTGTKPWVATLLLGLSLVFYAGLGLSSVHFRVPPQRETWLGPIIGAITGVITAATGVFIIPAVPYLQSLEMEKDELIQALGLSFIVFSAALAVNLSSAGAFENSNMLAVGMTLIMSFLGMFLGQKLRQKMDPIAFHRWFFIALFMLGLVLIARAML